MANLRRNNIAKQPVPATAPPAPPAPGEIDEDEELARMIAEDDAEKAAAAEPVERASTVGAKHALLEQDEVLVEHDEVLVEQAKVLGLKVDARWSVDTLAEKVLEAEEASIVTAKANFAAARKVPVRLKRDAWPLADERHNAGEIIEVPIAMAKAWFMDGVAERADPLPGDE